MAARKGAQRRESDRFTMTAASMRNVTTAPLRKQRQQEASRTRRKGGR